MATIKGTRSPLFYRHIPGGLPAVIDTSKFSGNIFYVDSNAATKADSVGAGYHPDKPFATLDYAVGQCTANQGDVIFVLPGHAETINAASAIDLDVAGISVIGLGNGEDRPTITIGSSEDASTVEIGAADVKIKNLILQPGNDGVDILLDINADGATVEDCELRSDETNAYQADTYIDIAGGANGADRCTIRRCKISSITAGATQAINIGAVEDALVIEDCWIDGDFSAAGILSGSIFTNALIRRNIVSNRAAGIHAIEFTAACTGLLVDNRMYGDTLGTILDPGSLKCLGNLETDAIDQAGVDSPRTSAGGLAADSITAAVIATGAIDADALAADAITAAKIAAAAIDAATFAADALQAMQDEAEDALEGENLDHLAATTTAAADMTTEVVDGSVISRILSKTSDTSSYDPTTDALEMLSDKAGAFTGDGGAGQDDSVKASLDLAHTDLDAIIADTQYMRTLDGATQVYPENVAADSIIAKIIAKGDPATPSTYNCTTDSLEMLSDKLGAFTGDGGAGQDDSVKASLDLAHTDLDAIIAATNGAWRIARSDWDFAVDTGAAAAYPVFTVTGNVLLQPIAICESSLTTGGGAVTVELGVSGNTAVFIAQIVDGRDLIANEIWLDATPTTTVESLDLEGTKTFIVSNGQDVEFLIGAGGLTGGKINFYALWKPLSANGAVAAN